MPPRGEGATSPAKGKMLQAGKGEIRPLRIGYPMRWQATPAGSPAIST